MAECFSLFMRNIFCSWAQAVYVFTSTLSGSLNPPFLFTITDQNVSAGLYENKHGQLVQDNSMKFNKNTNIFSYYTEFHQVVIQMKDYIEENQKHESTILFLGFK